MANPNVISLHVKTTIVMSLHLHHINWGGSTSVVQDTTSDWTKYILSNKYTTETAYTRPLPHYKAMGTYIVTYNGGTDVWDMQCVIKISIQNNIQNFKFSFIVYVLIKKSNIIFHFYVQNSTALGKASYLS